VIGYGIAHVSYSRLKLDQKLAWQHRQIAHELVARAERFASDVPPHRVDPGWAHRLRTHISAVVNHLPRDPRAIGTPMIAFYRNQAPLIGSAPRTRSAPSTPSPG
jgi:hypothetical protein